MNKNILFAALVASLIPGLAAAHGGHDHSVPNACGEAASLFMGLKNGEVKMKGGAHPYALIFQEQGVALDSRIVHVECQYADGFQGFTDGTQADIYVAHGKIAAARFWRGDKTIQTALMTDGGSYLRGKDLKEEKIFMKGAIPGPESAEGIRFTLVETSGKETALSFVCLNAPCKPLQ